MTYILTTHKENNGHTIATEYYSKDAETFVSDSKEASHLELDEAMSIQATYKERGYPVERILISDLL